MDSVQHTCPSYSCSFLSGSNINSPLQSALNSLDGRNAVYVEPWNQFWQVSEEIDFEPIFICSFKLQ